MAHATFVSYEIKSAKSGLRYARISALALDTPLSGVGEGGGGLRGSMQILKNVIFSTEKNS